jgi:hypothetical protein
MFVILDTCRYPRLQGAVPEGFLNQTHSADLVRLLLLSRVFRFLIHLLNSKYPLLFKNLVELTPEGDPERPTIDQCYSLFEDIVDSVNQAKDQSMNASALAKYDDILEGYDGKLSSDTRRFIRDGVVMKASAKVPLCL